LIADLADILSLTQELLWVGFCVFIRLGAMMATLPAFGEQSVPLRLRMGGTLAFVMLVAPIVDHDIGEIPNSTVDIIAQLGPEVVVGLFFGLALRFFVFALQIAGTIGAQSTSLSQIFGGTAGVDPQPAMGRVLVIAGLALAALLGLHVKIVAYIIISYDMVPFGVLISPDIVVSLGTNEVSRAFALGFTLAAPFVVASLIYNVTLGVINRAMPQLMVSFVGAPAITAGGLILMTIAAPVLLSVWVTAFDSFMANPFGASK
jgi:flagellar biosynthetic protein FliR